MKKYFFVLPLIASCSGLMNKSNRMTNASQVLYNGGALTHETVSDHNNRIGSVTSTTLCPNSFFMAASNNDTSFFEAFIKSDNNRGPIELMEYFKIKNIEGDNLFHIAAKQGNIDILITILDGLASLDPVNYTASIESFASDILGIKNLNSGYGDYFVDLLIKNEKIEALKKLLNDSKSKGFYIHIGILISSKNYANNCVKNRKNIECSQRVLEIIDVYEKDYKNSIEVYLHEDTGNRYIYNILGPRSLEELEELEGISLFPLDATLNPNSIDPLIPNVPNISNDITNHTEEKPHKCITCGKSFRYSSGLTVHERIHTKERPYKCDICENRFTKKSCMKRHVRTVHTEEKPYKCNICGKDFSRTDTLKDHKMRHKKIKADTLSMF